MTKIEYLHTQFENLGAKLNALCHQCDRDRKRIEALEASRQVHRIEALEALVRDSDSSAFDAVVKRIEALEAHHMTTLAELTPKLVAAHIDVERERQARWHSTRNAALQGLLANQYTDDGTSEFVDAALVEADRITDRAHGPLDAKPTPISGAEFVDGMEEAISQRNAEVDALVKAAQHVVNEWGESDGLDPRWQDNKASIALAIHGLSAAAKPFQVKP
jgi:hypothetical protein